MAKLAQLWVLDAVDIRAIMLRNTDKASATIAAFAQLWPFTGLFDHSVH